MLLGRSLRFLALLGLAYGVFALLVLPGINGQRLVLGSLVFFWLAYIAPASAPSQGRQHSLGTIIIYLLGLGLVWFNRGWSDQSLLLIFGALLAAAAHCFGTWILPRLALPMLSFWLFLLPQTLVELTPWPSWVCQVSAELVHGVLYYVGVDSVSRGVYVSTAAGTIQIAYGCSFMGILPLSLAVVVACYRSLTPSQLRQMLLWSVVCNMLFSMLRLTMFALVVGNHFLFSLLHDRLTLLFQILIVVLTLWPFPSVRKHLDLSPYFERIRPA